MNFKVLDLGLIDYREALILQRGVLDDVKQGRRADTLILCEHNNVFTLGRSYRAENILCGGNSLKRLGIDVVFSDRGGDITFHGPGQLIAYPVFNLRNWLKDVRFFLRRLEEAGGGMLKHYGVTGSSREGKTGVWVNNAKICSIGIALSNWVSYHGMGLNLNTDLSFFSLINPCGLKGVKMTSLEQILARKVNIKEAKEKLVLEFSRVFCPAPARTARTALSGWTTLSRARSFGQVCSTT